MRENPYLLNIHNIEVKVVYNQGMTSPEYIKNRTDSFIDLKEKNKQKIINT